MRRRPTVPLAVAIVALAAFAGAFALGSATAGTEETNTQPAAQQVDPPSADPQVPGLRATGSVPPLRVPPPSPDVAQDSGGTSTELPADSGQEPSGDAVPETPQEVAPTQPITPAEPVTPVTPAQPVTPPPPPPQGGGDG